jgi:cytochrome c oxidase cbb3-type subunit IV
MFKHYFEGAENIAVGPVISLIIFFVFFIILLYWVLKVDKGFINKMKDLPFDDTSVDSHNLNEKA